MSSRYHRHPSLTNEEGNLSTPTSARSTRRYWINGSASTRRACSCGVQTGGSVREEGVTLRVFESEGAVALQTIGLGTWTNHLSLRPRSVRPFRPQSITANLGRWPGLRRPALDLKSIVPGQSSGRLLAIVLRRECPMTADHADPLRGTVSPESVMWVASTSAEIEFYVNANDLDEWQITSKCFRDTVQTFFFGGWIGMPRDRFTFISIQGVLTIHSTCAIQLASTIIKLPDEIAEFASRLKHAINHLGRLCRGR